jgi:hypothetical protein
MHLLLLSLEVIERVCGWEGSDKSNPSRNEKPSHSKKKGRKRPGTDSPRVPKKVRTAKNCILCKKHGGAYKTHNTCDCRRFEKDGMEKSDFRAAKKGVKKPNPTKQSFAQLSEKLDKLEKVIKKGDTKKRKRRSSDSDSNFEQGIGSGSIGKVVINLEETCKKTNFIPPSPIKATPNDITSDKKYLSKTSVSGGDDVSMTSSTQNESNKVNYSTLVKGNPPEGKTTAVVAVMRGKSKHGYHRHRSNKHYKKQIVQVLLDSGSDGDLVFVNKDKPMLLPYPKRLVPQLRNTLNGIFQTKGIVWVELNLFDYSDSKLYHSEPDVVKYRKDKKPQYDLILGNETMKELGIVLDFNSLGASGAI